MRGATILRLFGGPGFLHRVPPHTSFDMVSGVIEVPRRDMTPERFVRSQHSRLWHSVEGAEEPRAMRAH